MQLVTCLEADKTQQRHAADLVYSSFREFYDRIEISRSELSEQLADEFVSEGTEANVTVLGLVDGECAGVFSAYRDEEMQARQQASVFHLLSTLTSQQGDDFLQAIASHRDALPPVPAQSYYLSRFAVAAKWHGMGVADQLFDAYWKAGSDSTSMSLHVRSSNLRAISFYRRHGMTPCCGAGLPYICMTAER